ncbi:hypothetical protein AAEX63_13365 [Luteococcus sp. H138]|uniref:hypothetical protein n=1 Tax=unclassified Luteococcus TaxID=2639923 RepID=UPI00313B21D6
MSQIHGDCDFFQEALDAPDGPLVLDAETGQVLLRTAANQGEVRPVEYCPFCGEFLSNEHHEYVPTPEERRELEAAMRPVLQALALLVNDPMPIVQLVHDRATRDEALHALQKHLGLSGQQAMAILDCQLGQLPAAERAKIQQQ